MPAYICTTCGTQFAPSDQPPSACPICEDVRQYVGWGGQNWTTLEGLQRGHMNSFRTEDSGLLGIGMSPAFAINQRALLIQTPQGNVLWDCISLLDEATVQIVRALGGVKAIAISHPHYYSSMVEWAQAFDAPIHLHESSRKWVMRPDDAIHYWEGETHTLGEGLTLIRTGGHFSGSLVLHWQAGAEGRGALLTGDTIMVASDRRYVSFMYSFPNYIPLKAPAVNRIVEALEPYEFEQIYGAWWDRKVTSEGKLALKRSAARYLDAIRG